MLLNGMNVILRVSALLVLFIVLTLDISSVTAAFKNCDYNYKIYAGYKYKLNSDRYLNSRDPKSSCRFRYTAPRNHYIVATCSIYFQKEKNCKTESFYVAVNGDRNLYDSEKLCGTGTFSRHSIFQSLVLAYESDAPIGSKGSFNCNLHAVSKPCDCGWSINMNIANGNETFANEYPSMVALKTKENDGYKNVLFCSAVIISNRYMLTAAHCANYHDIANMQAWVGRHNIETDSPSGDTVYAQVYNIGRRIVHPQYSTKPLNNDIALLQTTRNIQFSKGVGPICLPPYSNVDNDFSWQHVDVIGWGATKFSSGTSDTLQKITVLTTSHEACKDIYKTTDTIFQTQICTRDNTDGRKDSCQFDSGGPVIFRHIWRQYLVGIISFGHGCAIQENPIGVNTRITSYLPWIYQETGRSTCNIEM